MAVDLVGFIGYIRRVDPEKILNFTKQLYFLLNSGIPLFRCIQIIERQTSDPKLKRILQIFLKNLSEGKSFTDCVSLYPENFSPFYCNMITVGESRGELESSLQRIYNYLKSSKELREKIINSLTYPIILMVSGITVLTAMIVFVLPRFSEIFASSNIPLPLPTRILLGIHQFVITKYPWIFITLILLVFLQAFLRRYPKARYYLDKYTLEFPITGELFQTIYISRFCRTLGTLYNSGVQLLPAIELSKSSCNNQIMHKDIDLMIESVRDGKGIAKPLAKSKVFLPMVAQMIAVGEETGALEKVLLDLADYYEQETDFKIKRQLALIEPIALIIISLFVMFIASAVMLPLFKMSTAIRAF